MYIIKVKGKAPIGNYVQLRDENFTLLAYFRAEHPDRALENCGLAAQKETIRGIINDLPYGKLKQINIA